MKPITTGEKVIAIRKYFEAEIDKRDTEIQRLKGLVEKAYQEGYEKSILDERGYTTDDEDPLSLKEFKTKHEL